MRCWFIVILCLLLQISLQADKKKNVGKDEERKSIIRGYRQAPAKPTRRPSFFMLLRGFVSETLADANKAANNISTIFSDTFPSITGNTQVPVNTTDEDFLSFQNVTDILGRNFRSLRRLFNREWSNAIRDSRKNLARYRKEFRNALLPYLTPDDESNTTTTQKP